MDLCWKVSFFSFTLYFAYIRVGIGNFVYGQSVPQKQWIIWLCMLCGETQRHGLSYHIGNEDNSFHQMGIGFAILFTVKRYADVPRRPTFFIGIFYWRKRKGRAKYRITLLSVYFYVKIIYLEIAWRYQAEINPTSVNKIVNRFNFLLKKYKKFDQTAFMLRYRCIFYEFCRVVKTYGVIFANLH